jgi:hypothetical protein
MIKSVKACHSRRPQAGIHLPFCHSGVPLAGIHWFAFVLILISFCHSRMPQAGIHRF